MALSKVEKDILNAAIQRFLNQREATKRRDLVLEFEDPDAIDRLVQWQLLVTYDSANYLPTAISFHYCGNPDVEALARRSVRTVAHVFKTYFEKTTQILQLRTLKATQENCMTTLTGGSALKHFGVAHPLRMQRVGSWPQIVLNFIYTCVVIFLADCDNPFESSSKTGIVAPAESAS
jgi:hypothetical protein